MLDSRTAASEAQHATSERVRTRVQTCLEGDVGLARRTGKRGVTPVDVPREAKSHAEEPRPWRRIGSRRDFSPDEEGPERIAWRAVGTFREEGDHPAALAADPEPTLLLALTRGFPADRPSAPLALVRRRRICVHSTSLPAFADLAVAPVGPHPWATVRPEAGWRADALPLVMHVK
jgi:hypothetical protein